MKLQDYYKNQDGTDLMNQAVAFKIVSLRGTKAADNKYGEKFACQLYKMPEETPVIWELSEEQIGRIFSKTNKAGAVEWTAKDGDTVNITKCSPYKPGGYAFYKAEPNTGDIPAPSIPKPDAPFNFGLPKPSAGGTEWDGSPRQNNYRKGLLELVCAHVAAGASYSETLKQTCIDILMDVRRAADELERTYVLS